MDEGPALTGLEKEEAERLFIEAWERWGRGEMTSDTFRMTASAYAAVLSSKRKAANLPFGTRSRDVISGPPGERS